MGGEDVVGVSGKVKLLVESGAEGADAVQMQGQPQPQAAMFAGEFGAKMGVVRKSGVGEVLQVVPRVPITMGGGEQGRIAHQQSTSSVGQEQALVRVEGDRVGPHDASQPGSPAVGELKEPAVTAIHVEPQTLLARQGSQLAERVDGTSVGGAGGSNEQERLKSIESVLRNGCCGGVDLHVPTVSGGDKPDG